MAVQLLVLPTHERLYEVVVLLYLVVVIRSN